MAMHYVFMTLCLFGATSARSATSSTCPNLETKKDFNVTRFTGRWYQAGSYLNVDAAKAHSCHRIDYNFYQNGSCTFLHSEEIKQSLYDPDITLIPRASDSKTCDPTEPARFMANSEDDVKQPNEWILETDYTSFAIVYKCTEGLSEEQHPVVILTREKSPLLLTTKKIAEFVVKNIISRRSKKIFMASNQKNCRNVYGPE